MNLKEIAQKFDKNKRKIMMNVVIKQENYMRNYTTYHAESLSIMFAEWHLLFTNHKQDIKCTSCRKAVVKFWSAMAEEWIEIERKPKKSNATKKAKTK